MIYNYGGTLLFPVPKNNPQTTSKQPQKQPLNNLKTKLQLFVFLYFYYLIIKYLFTLVITLEL